VRGLRKSEVDPATVTAAQFAATKEISFRDGGRPPTLVVWPEDVVSLDTLIDGTQVERQLGALAVGLHATLLVGVTETVSAQSFRNEVVAFSPQGKLVARYEKVHRVPFGEYIPYRGFFKHLANLSSVPLDAIPGHGNGVLHTPAGPLGTLISYEVFDARRGLVATRAGAELLVDPTNTSSYLTSQVPTQEIAAARLQAISEGRDVVQAAPTGFSAVIDYRGRVLARTDLAVRALIIRNVELRKGRTIYERVGDLPVLVLGGILVAVAWIVAFGPETDPDRAHSGRLRRAMLERRSKRRST
jgi:apolipoprotein N-acyltransferase